MSKQTPRKALTGCAHALVFVIFVGAVRTAVAQILDRNTVTVWALERMPRGTNHCNCHYCIIYNYYNKRTT